MFPNEKPSAAFLATIDVKIREAAKVRAEADLAALTKLVTDTLAGSTCEPLKNLGDEFNHRAMHELAGHHEQQIAARVATLLASLEDAIPPSALDALFAMQKGTQTPAA